MVAPRYNRYVVFIWLLLCVYCSGREERRPESKHVMSASQRIRVSGPAEYNHVQLAVWGDSVIRELEAYCRISIPFDRGYALQLNLHRGSVPVCQYHESTGDNGFYMSQSIELYDPARMNQEELLETLVKALLRLKLFTMDRSATPAERRIPDWFSVAVAQNLFPATRTRNRDLMLSEQSGGSRHSISNLLSYRVLPKGVWPQKAAVAEWLNWCRTLRPDICEQMLKQWSVKQPVTLQDLVRWLPPFGSEAQMEEAWNVWVQQLRRPGLISGEKPPLAVLQAIHDVLQATPEMVLEAGGERPDGMMGIPDLIATRSAQWVENIAKMMQFKLMKLVMAQPEDVAALVRDYNDYLNDLHGAGRPRGLLPRLFKASDQSLQDRYRKLEVRRADLLHLYQRKTTMLDAHEPPRPTRSASSKQPTPAPLDRSPMQRFVDQFDH